MTTEQAQGDGGAKRARPNVGEGIRQGIGVLSALKDALEETIQEARERGDLSADRARDAVKEALGRAQAAAAGAKDRLDFAHQADLEELRETVSRLAERISALEARVSDEGLP